MSSTALGGSTSRLTSPHVRRLLSHKNSPVRALSGASQTSAAITALKSRPLSRTACTDSVEVSPEKTGAQTRALWVAPSIPKCSVCAFSLPCMLMILQVLSDFTRWKS